jgi:hypothetical protein
VSLLDRIKEAFGMGRPASGTGTPPDEDATPAPPPPDAPAGTPEPPGLGGVGSEERLPESPPTGFTRDDDPRSE